MSLDWYLWRQEFEVAMLGRRKRVVALRCWARPIPKRDEGATTWDRGGVRLGGFRRGLEVLHVEELKGILRT